MHHQSSRDLKERVKLIQPSHLLIFLKNQLYDHIRTSHHPYKRF